MQGIILIAYDVTKEQELKRQMQLALIKEKSINLQKSKEQSFEQDILINDLNNELEELKKELEIFKSKNNSNNNEKSLLKKQQDENIKLSDEIQELKKEIDKLNNIIETSDSSEVLKEKLEYWEQRSKQESEKLESLEKAIIANVEPSIIEKIFN